MDFDNGQGRAETTYADDGGVAVCDRLETSACIDPRMLRWRTLETHWQHAHESAAVLSRLLDSRIQAFLDGVGQPPSFAELMSVRSARFREQEARDEADDYMLRMLGSEC